MPFPRAFHTKLSQLWIEVDDDEYAATIHPAHDRSPLAEIDELRGQVRDLINLLIDATTESL